MKAYHVQDLNGEMQEIVFADKRSEAITKSEAIGWNDYINVRAKRAKYADDLEKDPQKLAEIKLKNGWWIECHAKCENQVTIESDYTINETGVYCGECGDKGESGDD